MTPLYDVGVSYKEFSMACMTFELFTYDAVLSVHIHCRGTAFLRICTNNLMCH